MIVLERLRSYLPLWKILHERKQFKSDIFFGLKIPPLCLSMPLRLCDKEPATSYYALKTREQSERRRDFGSL